mmetsp:Transcript_49418/g.55978  ORF Transcript_49418/g.55978 Transcript_49418/m.55978 type:complete len:111 (+) Transcript_49418:293-625(+)
MTSKDRPEASTGNKTFASRRNNPKIRSVNVPRTFETKGDSNNGLLLFLLLLLKFLDDVNNDDDDTELFELEYKVFKIGNAAGPPGCVIKTSAPTALVTNVAASKCNSLAI